LKATQGVPLIQNFNHKTGEFFAKLDINPAVGAPTVIYTSTDFWYPNGYSVEIADTFTDHVMTAKQVKIDRSDPRNLKFQVLDKYVKQVTVNIKAL
jgi:hypothetical protein